MAASVEVMRAGVKGVVAVGIRLAGAVGAGVVVAVAVGVAVDVGPSWQARLAIATRGINRRISGGC
jgi:hypothetical protein